VTASSGAVPGELRESDDEVKASVLGNVLHGLKPVRAVRDARKADLRDNKCDRTLRDGPLRRSIRRKAGGVTGPFLARIRKR
jgi:hypothetical protein